MISRLLPFFLLAAALPAVSQISTTFEPSGGTYSAQVKRYVKTIERAFYRSMSVIDELGHQPSAFTMTHPFNAVGNFAPREAAGMAWSLAGVTEDVSVLCVSRIAATKLEWGESLYGLSQAGLRPAAADCGPTLSFPVPTSYPAAIHAIKTLDRRDVPTSTVLPIAGELVFSGVTTRPASLPGLQLSSMVSPGYANIVIRNLVIPIDVTSHDPNDKDKDKKDKDKDGDGAVLTEGAIGLVGVKVRDGFTYTHNCDVVVPGDSCLFRLRYEGLQGDLRVGNLRLEFSNGSFAVISLLGRTK